MKKLESLNYEDELVLFYNKFLNIGLGEGFLVEIVKKCSNKWLNDRSFTEEDKNKQVIFNKMELEFLSFKPTRNIKIGEDYIITIDAYGHIIKFQFNPNFDLSQRMELESYLNESIFTLLENLPFDTEVMEAQEKAQNMILQNILVSKIGKAIYEKIKSESFLAATQFKNKNITLITYEENLRSELDYEEEFKSKLASSRSLR